VCAGRRGRGKQAGDAPYRNAKLLGHLLDGGKQSGVAAARRAAEVRRRQACAARVYEAWVAAAGGGDRECGAAVL
jgi:hypothetical protein